MEKLLDFLSGFDIQTILTMIGCMWYFSRHIDSKIDKHIARIDQNIARIDQQIIQQAARSDKLYEMFIDLLKRGKK